MPHEKLAKLDEIWFAQHALLTVKSRSGRNGVVEPFPLEKRSTTTTMTTTSSIGAVKRNGSWLRYVRLGCAYLLPRNNNIEKPALSDEG